MPNNADATKGNMMGGHTVQLLPLTQIALQRGDCQLHCLCFRRDPFRLDPCNLCWRLRDFSHNVSGAEEIDHHEADLRL